MEGTAFFPSAMRAFGLIARNIARVAMVTVVGSVAVAIGLSIRLISSLMLNRKDLCDGCVCWVGLSLHVQLHEGSHFSSPSVLTFILGPVDWICLANSLRCIHRLVDSHNVLRDPHSDIRYSSPSKTELLCFTHFLQGFLIEEEFERNAAKGRGLSKAKSHAQKSMKGVLDKQQSMRPDVIRQHSQL